MAITVVQHTGASLGSANVSASFASNVTAGNAIVVMGCTFQVAPTISDSLNGSGGYTEVFGPYQPTGNYEHAAWLLNSSLGGACTITLTGGTASHVHLFELSHSGGTLTYDTGAGNSGAATTSPVTGTVTTSQTVELLLAAFRMAGVNFTAGTGWTNGLQTSESTFTGRYFSETKAVASTGSYQGTATTDVSNSYDAFVIGVYESGAGPSRGLFRTPPVTGVGIGGSFFRDVLQDKWR